MSLPAPAPDSTALVTGASAGIGREIARALAARGYGVTLVARRAERLEALAEELRAAHGVRVEVLPADLASAVACEELVAEVGRRGLQVEILVNNAGFGIYGPFGSAPLDREFEQLMVLIGAPVDLTGRLLPGMLERGRGTVINLSSTAGFQALPGNANYAACKAFVLLHSEALGEEVRRQGVTVTAVCPGPVRTEFQATSDPHFADSLPKFTWTTPERVAADALRAAERGKRSIVPGGLLKRMVFAPNRRMPSWLALPVSRRVMAQDLQR
jgi:short-subunit dehydrogenase